MSISDIQDGVKGRIASWHLRRKLFTILGILLLGFAIYAAVILYYPFSEGTRTGILRKLSHKGYVFKTWEGELQMSAVMVPQTTEENISGGNIWHFSVTDQAVVDALQKAETSGKRVTLTYTEYLKKLFWRGDTKHFINKVQVIEE
jgi:hypothetical protein